MSLTDILVIVLIVLTALNGYALYEISNAFCELNTWARTDCGTSNDIVCRIARIEGILRNKFTESNGSEDEESTKARMDELDERLCRIEEQYRVVVGSDISILHEQVSELKLHFESMLNTFEKVHELNELVDSINENDIPELYKQTFQLREIKASKEDLKNE